MKVIIEPEEGEEYERYEWSNVYQLSLSANHMIQKQFPGRISHNVIGDKFELAGMISESLERVKAHDGT